MSITTCSGLLCILVAFSLRIGVGFGLDISGVGDVAFGREPEEGW